MAQANRLQIIGVVLEGRPKGPKFPLVRGGLKRVLGAHGWGGHDL